MDLHEMVGAYALHALDDDDARRFEEHLAHCDECQAELASLEGALDALAEPGDDESAVAPVSLHASVFDEIAHTTQVSAPEPTTAPDSPAEPASLDAARASAARRPRRLGPRLLVAAAGLLAVVAVGVGFFASGADERALADEAERVRTADDSIEYALGLGAATLHVSQAEGGVALIGDTPDLPDGETYQVWVVPADGSAPVPGPVLGDGELALAWITELDGAAAVAISVEPEGGSETPTEVVTAVEL
ncbi:anti-sigma factor domain-containing protein [Demequina aestuarii]|uniref:anti-sigma factor n=1 Tax=Demequina aestuarii TaxID=327095 RepID=UPI0007816331|nr:anti-sigma factor [Demequina aestuarii]